MGKNLVNCLYAGNLHLGFSVSLYKIYKMEIISLDLVALWMSQGRQISELSSLPINFMVLMRINHSKFLDQSYQ